MSSFRQLEKIFRNQSEDTWERLSFAKASLANRGVLGSVRFGEETITDLMMMDLYFHGSSLLLFHHSSKSMESKRGTDFELWLGSPRLGWFRYAVQAKKLDLNSNRYSSLAHRNKHGMQIDLLKRYAKLNRAAPLYCLYNFSDEATVSEHWHCCSGPPSLKDLGCTVTPLTNIRKAISKRGERNFRRVHMHNSTLPWRCLVSCPAIQKSLGDMSRYASSNSAASSLPLIDPMSCYHRRLPSQLRVDVGHSMASTNQAGGVLISIRLDAEWREDGFVQSWTSNAYRRRMDGPFHPDGGVPARVVVLRVEGVIKDFFDRR